MWCGNGVVSCWKTLKISEKTKLKVRTITSTHVVNKVSHEKTAITCTRRLSKFVHLVNKDLKAIIRGSANFQYWLNYISKVKLPYKHFYCVNNIERNNLAAYIEHYYK